MRNKLVLIYCALLCVAFGGLIVKTQRDIQQAPSVYFKIVPVDPRALLSGDYMELAFDFENLARPLGFRPGYGSKDLTLFVGEDGVVGVNETPSAQTLSLHFNGTRFNVPHQFYFEEGQADKYENAVYAKMKVLPGGRLAIAALTDGQFNEL